MILFGKFTPRLFSAFANFAVKYDSQMAIIPMIMCNFTLTVAAAKQVLTAAHNCNAEHKFLRVTGRPDVTGAVLHGMGFDSLRADDLQFESEGIRIVVTPGHVALLDGCVLDFVQLNTGQSLFVFVNPNDQGCVNSLGTCGFCDVKCRPPLTPLTK